MSYSLTTKEVQILNQNHKHYADVYKRGNPAITGAVIYSRITEVKNDTFFLEIYINDDWKITPKQTAIIFLNYWLNNNEALQKCKYFEVTLFTGASLGFASLTQTNFQEFINIVANKIKLQEYQKMSFSLSNIPKLKERFKRLLNSSKHYPFNTTIYKLIIDLDLQFYDMDLNSFLRVYADNEAEYYNSKVIGVPTVLKIELANNNGYIEFPNLEYSKLPNHSHFAVITFKRTNKTYSTKAVTNIQVVELDSIEIYKFVRYRGIKRIANTSKF